MDSIAERKLNQSMVMSGNVERSANTLQGKTAFDVINLTCQIYFLPLVVETYRSLSVRMNTYFRSYARNLVDNGWIWRKG